jgi:hypothetical protein
MHDTFSLTSSQLIDLLGGTKMVAKLAKVSPAAVTHWRTKEISEGKLLFLAAELEKQSHGLITRKSLFPQTYKFIWPELE